MVIAEPAMISAEEKRDCRIYPRGFVGLCIRNPFAKLERTAGTSLARKILWYIFTIVCSLSHSRLSCSFADSKRPDRSIGWGPAATSPLFLHAQLY